MKTTKSAAASPAADTDTSAAPAVSVNMPTDRGEGIDTVVATDGDAPQAEAGTEDRSEAGDAREGVAPAAAVTTAAALDASAPANIPPATEIEPSGAPIQTTDVDMSHPAVDANPRANTTVDQNRIDFNDPVRTGSEIVTDALKGA